MSDPITITLSREEAFAIKAWLAKACEPGYPTAPQEQSAMAKLRAALVEKEEDRG